MLGSCNVESVVVVVVVVMVDRMRLLADSVVQRQILDGLDKDKRCLYTIVVARPVEVIKMLYKVFVCVCVWQVRIKKSKAGRQATRQKSTTRIRSKRNLVAVITRLLPLKLVTIACLPVPSHLFRTEFQIHLGRSGKQHPDIKLPSKRTL